MDDLLTVFRRILDDHYAAALISLEDIMLRHGATDEELDREAAFWQGFWKAEQERELARLAAWLGRGGQALQ
jgi:hypothetical protein